MTRNLTWAAPLMLIAMPAVAQQAGGDARASGTAAPTPAIQTTSSGTVTTPLAAPAAVPAPAPKVKKICRTFTVTGRRIADTECRTKDQWAAIDQANEAAAKRFQDRAAANATLNSGGGGGMGGVSSAAGVIGLP